MAPVLGVPELTRNSSTYSQCAERLTDLDQANNLYQILQTRQTPSELSALLGWTAGLVQSRCSRNGLRSHLFIEDTQQARLSFIDPDYEGQGIALAIVYNQGVQARLGAWFGTTDLAPAQWPCNVNYKTDWCPVSERSILRFIELVRNPIF